MRRMVWLCLVGLGLFLCVMMLVPARPDRESARRAPGTVFSSGPRGARAFFVLLQKMHMQPTILRRSTYAQQPDGATLWILGENHLGRREKQDLQSFLQRGGSVVLRPRNAVALLAAAHAGAPDVQDALGMHTLEGPELALRDPPVAVTAASPPEWTLAEDEARAPVIASWRVGKGLVVSLGTPDIVENKRIGLGANGLFLAHLAMRLGEHHVFDEVQTGLGETDMMTLLARAPYRWGVVQAALAALAGLLGFAMRRFPVRPPPQPVRRRTLDHVDAVARLWQQARDAALPLQALLRATRERTAARMGGRAQQEPFVAWVARVRPEDAAQAQACWQQATTLANETHPDAGAALAVAAQLRQLEEKRSSW